MITNEELLKCKQQILEIHSKDLRDFWVKILDLFDTILVVVSIDEEKKKELHKSCRSKILRIGNNKIRQFEEKIDVILKLKG